MTDTKNMNAKTQMTSVDKSPFIELKPLTPQGLDPSEQLKNMIFDFGSNPRAWSTETKMSIAALAQLVLESALQ